MREEISWERRMRWKGRAGYSEGFRLLVFRSAAMVNECVGNECVYKQSRVVTLYHAFIMRMLEEQVREM